MPVMDEFRKEREAIKHAPLEKRLEYFRDYYLGKTLLILFVVGMLGAWLISVITAKEPALYITLVNFTELQENYVIFITENDVIGLNEPIYHIDRIIREGNVQFEDGEHIIYVNGSLRVMNTALGKLMSDFFCSEAKDMNYKVLSDRVRQYKETEKGVDDMCEIWDEVRNEGILKNRIETAQKMIKDGALPLEKIAEYSGLSLDKIRELAGNKTA